MSLRGLLVLVGLLAATVSVLLWLDSKSAPPGAAAPDAPLVRAFTEDTVHEIELACDGARVTLARATPRGFRIVQPFAAEADPRRVHEVVAALQDARVRKVIAEGSADLAAFGLAPALCTVGLGFGTGSSALTLRLGRGSPVGSERYAARDGAGVVLTDGSLYGVLARGAEAFREKRLFPVDPEEITQIALDRPDGRLAVVRVNDAWRVEAPARDVASSYACANLARAIAAIELSGSAATRAPVDVRRKRRLRLEVTARGATATMVAYVATAGIDGKRLGWRDGGAIAGLVDESAARELERPVASFRESRIASFSLPDVRRLTIERGGTTLRIERAGEASPWTGLERSGAFSVDGVRVDALLDRLRSLTGAGFEPGASGTPATGTIAVLGERGDLARLTFGPLTHEAASEAESVWMTTPTRPGVVFRVGAGSLGPIPRTPDDLAPKPTPPSAASGGR